MQEGTPANSPDVLKSVENNIKKYGIGLKDKKAHLSKEETTKLALLRNPKADPRVLKNLQEIKNNYDNRIEKKQNKEKQELDALGKEKEVLRKMLMKRSLE